MIGKTLGGRYKLIRVLGAGNFGQTFLAEDIHRPIRAKCVVKYLRPARTDAAFLPLARSLFQREAQILERLGSHEQIPRLLAYFEEDNEFYLVQDFIEGQVLRHELLPGCAWSEARVMALLQDALRVLAFVHQCGVIHRDIKPDNLIRRQSDHRLVLIDFGAVKEMGVSIGGGTLVGETNPQTIAIGTPGYMAPEQAQGRPRPASDLYALGMVAVQALTGLSPLQLTQDPYGCWCWQAAEPVSDRLVQFVNKLIHPSPYERFTTATDALASLQQVEVPKSFWFRLGKFLKTPVQDLWRSPEGRAARLPKAGGGASTVPPRPLPAVSTLPPQVTEPKPVSSPAAATAALSNQGRHVFISHSSDGTDLQLASALQEVLQKAGHQPFMASQSIRLGEAWAQRIDQELKRCDFFVLLLSQTAAQSEMVLEEVRTVKQLQAQRGDRRPFILPVRVNFPLDMPLNYELRGYLHRLQQRFWRSPADTDTLLQEILDLVNATTAPVATSSDAAQETIAESAQIGTLVGDGAPVPVAEPELPEGQVEVASAFYIERPPIEQRCRETLLQPGSLIRIKAPRQMGKTSLMARLLYRATQEGYGTVPLSFQLADAQVFSDLEKLLRWLCASVGRRLGLENRLNEYWDDIFGSKYNCTTYFEEYLLPNCQKAGTQFEGRPLVLGLDEVDRVFEYPEVASDFFGLLRAWHEEGKNRDIWRNLRLIVVHGTEVYIPLDINQSPFNVGLAIDLPEFNQEQIAELCRLHGLSLSEEQLQDLQHLVGGHPYLIRLSLYHLARQDLTWQALIANAASETGLYRDHLRRQWWHLQQQADLVPAFKEILQADNGNMVDSTVGFKLHSLGLITLEGNLAKVRCDLYRRYFGDRLH
ncbi:AAA-like domain-containing protein [Thermosynechococcus sp. PKX82]|uniref:AAA-like domain-containing protein n=1 Tax=Thermosynechococcus sp. PKX82 TaxID=3074086 RepID=UPI002873BA38|nr:AAA-like domain-containing protein [Thermosynechococcus sp. PKX82]WNC30671.1 AAA-like domain-containing protein [Thermosynechococcus sp. PKX82]